MSRMLRPMCSSISMLTFLYLSIKCCTEMCESSETHMIRESLCKKPWKYSERPRFHIYNTQATLSPGLKVSFSCHRKSNEDALKERRRVSVLCNMMEPSLLQFYISRQWLNKFKTFAEPGPISNRDFLCSHGGMRWHNHHIP